MAGFSFQRRKNLLNNEKSRETKLEEIQERIDQLCDEKDAALNKVFPVGHDVVDNFFEVYESISAPYFKELSILCAQRSLLLEPEYEPIPEYCVLMTLDEYVEACKGGLFIESDGGGYYSTDKLMTRISCNPKFAVAGVLRTDFTHIAWFNK